MQDGLQTCNQSSNKLEKKYNINVKIEDKTHQGKLFRKEYAGFFKAREICGSNNMSLPHQGFEIVQTKDMDQIPSGMSWIDAFVNSNFSIVCPWKGSDEKIIKEMLEEALEGFQKRMLGKYGDNLYQCSKSSKKWPKFFPKNCKQDIPSGGIFEH